MRSFSADDCFDGYPTTSNADYALCIEALAESNAGVPADQRSDVLMNLAYHASNIHDDREAYDNARRFIAAYVDNTITCNMIEGENPFFE